MDQWWHPVELLRKRVIMDAAQARPAEGGSLDRAYVQRLRQLARIEPPLRAEAGLGRQHLGDRSRARRRRRLKALLGCRSEVHGCVWDGCVEVGVWVWVEG